MMVGKQRTGGVRMIYLDNAATTLRKPPQVIDAVARAMGLSLIHI